MKLLAVLSLLTASFWDSKAPADWTDNQLIQLFTDSPWAQMVGAPGGKDPLSPPVQIYIATAATMQQGEKEKLRRYARKGNAAAVESPMDTEYRLWFEDNMATQIVLAVRINRNKAFDDAAQTKLMENDSIMRVGRKRYKMTANFPPTQHETFLHMAFPRQVQETDKIVTFELYIPGATPPYRTVEFKVKDMIVNGKLEL
jgi:hypothetical protein